MAILEVKKQGQNIALPAPSRIQVGDEIIWSSNTGRTADGYMVGDIIAEKESLDITWSYLTKGERNLIKNNLVAGFFPLIINIDGSPYELEIYRGTLMSVPLGMLDDGNYYFQEITVSIIER